MTGGVGVWVMALMAAILIDAVVGLSVSGLVFLDVLIVGTGLGCLGYVVRIWLMQQPDARRTARLFEQRLEMTDSRLINVDNLVDVLQPLDSLVLARTMPHGTRR